MKDHEKYINLAWLKDYLHENQWQLEAELDEMLRYSSEYETKIPEYEAMIKLLGEVEDWCEKHFIGIVYQGI